MCQEPPEKFQLFTINISSPPGPLKNCRTPFIRPEKKFFEVCLVGTLNLCLKVPKRMQKTRDESDQSRLRKRPKTTEKRSKYEFGRFLTVFGRFLSLDWSDWFLVFSSVQAPRDTRLEYPQGILWRFFCPYKGGSATFRVLGGDEKFEGDSWNFFGGSLQNPKE